MEENIKFNQNVDVDLNTLNKSGNAAHRIKAITTKFKTTGWVIRQVLTGAQVFFVSPHKVKRMVREVWENIQSLLL